MKIISGISNNQDTWLGVVAVLVLTLSITQPASCDEPPQIEWTNVYGGTEAEVGYSVYQTADHGFIAVGYTTSFSNEGDIYVVRTKENGDTVWTKVYGGPGEDCGYAVQETADLGFIIAGCVGVGGEDSDAYLLKIDMDGDFIWEQTYGGTGADCANAVVQTDDLGYIVAGFMTVGGMDADVHLLRTDSLGNIVWEQTYGGAGADIGHSVDVITDSSEGFVITGSTESFGSGLSDVYIIRTDTNGDTLWTKTYGDKYEDVGKEVRVTTNNYECAIVGHTSENGAPCDAFLLWVDDSGHITQDKIFQDSDYEYASSVFECVDEGFIIGGYWTKGGEDKDIYLLRTDDMGQTLWGNKPFDPEFDQGFNSVQQTHDGGYIACGWSHRKVRDGQMDLYLVKYKYKTVGSEENAFNDNLILTQYGSNPFRDNVFIGYTLSKECVVSVTVYNQIGQAVRTLVHGEAHRGLYTAIWDGRDERGKAVPTGVYFVRVKAGEDSATEKLVKLN